MNQFWSYLWLIDELAKADRSIDARIVTVAETTLLVSGRGERISSLPIEGKVTNRLDAIGGVSLVGTFSLNAESDKTRAAFVNQVLVQLKSPKASPVKRSLSFFERAFRDLDGGEN